MLPERRSNRSNNVSNTEHKYGHSNNTKEPNTKYTTTDNSGSSGLMVSYNDVPSSNASHGAIDEDTCNEKKKTNIVEILDFDLKNVKQEKDVRLEETTMELELKVEIEPDTHNCKRVNASQSSCLGEACGERGRHLSNASNTDDIQHGLSTSTLNEQPDAERPLPPPLISKPIGTNCTPLSPSYTLQPPPLIMNPRYSNEGKTLPNVSNLNCTEDNTTEEEIMKIKKEIRDDIQSEMMTTPEEFGGIGNAVAASFMNPFNSVLKNNAQNSSCSSHLFQTNTTSLLPRSITNNQMYVPKLNTLITTSSYVNLPLCTPNVTASTGPRPINVTEEVTSPNSSSVSSPALTTYKTLSLEQPVKDIIQVQHLNGAQYQQQPNTSNANTILDGYSTQNTHNANQPILGVNNQVKTGFIGKNVRERLVKHLEDKHGEASLQNTIPELPSIVNYSDGRYSTSPTACNKGAGRILVIPIYLP